MKKPEKRSCGTGAKSKESILLTSASEKKRPESLNNVIWEIVGKKEEEYFSLYRDLHKNPELSNREIKTSKKMAEGLRSLGFEVTEGLGGNGVAGVFKNGEGKVVMLRTEMDALGIREQTGFDFASTAMMSDGQGNEYPVMHACGHDLHMTVWLGILNTLVDLKDEWKGTLMAVAQPAEEGTTGARAMLRDGLFTKFSRPDAALCYHVNPELPAGTVGYYPGPVFAGVKTAEITVLGMGGHGAMPHNTIDPVVLSAKIILDIQTIVSRRINPVKPAVVTVGAIHGGTRNNVIPDEVRMLLTIRYFEDDVLRSIMDSLKVITRGAAIAAGLPEDKMPRVVFSEVDNPPVLNNPELVITAAESMKELLGEENVILVEPATTAEDFGNYGLTEEKVPIALFWLGGVNPTNYLNHLEKGERLPPLHSALFAPDYKPAYRCGVAAMTIAVIRLLRQGE